MLIDQRAKIKWCKFVSIDRLYIPAANTTMMLWVSFETRAIFNDPPSSPWVCMCQFASVWVHGHFSRNIKMDVVRGWWWWWWILSQCWSGEASPAGQSWLSPFAFGCVCVCVCFVCCWRWQVVFDRWSAIWGLCVLGGSFQRGNSDFCSRDLVQFVLVDFDDDIVRGFNRFIQIFVFFIQLFRQ